VDIPAPAREDPHREQRLVGDHLTREERSMSEHDEPEPAETEDDVEAHGLKEAAITGLSAAALIAGGGDAIAATTPGHAAATSKQAVHKIDAAHKGAAIHKDAMWKGAAVQKDSADPTLKRGWSADPTLKRATDPTLKRGSLDPTLKRGGPGAT
jgi:hypothetical protein